MHVVMFSTVGRHVPPVVGLLPRTGPRMEATEGIMSTNRYV